MPKVLDTYQQWEKDGVLNKKLKEIEDLSSKRISQCDISRQLGVSEKTFISLKRKHSKIKDAMYRGKEKMKIKLQNAMYELAIGATSETRDSKIEKDSKGQKKEHIHVITKKEKPNYNALRYLMIVYFGKEFNEKRREIDVMEKRLLLLKEESWSNASDNEID